MKKLLLSLSLVLALGTAQAQNLTSYGFVENAAGMAANGWQFTNQSTPIYVGAPTWSVANYAPHVVSAAAPATPFGTVAYTTGQSQPAPTGQDGVNNQFAIVNYTSTGTSSTTGSGTISNWMITPVVTVKNGDIVSFYTRLGRPSSVTTASFADNLQFRMSANGDFTVNPTAGSGDVGDFTQLLVEVNPALNLTSYPTSWTKYSYTIVGLTGDTAVKFAFRYFVTNGGPAGANSDIIGVDTYSVDRPLAVNTFFAQNFAVYPNPADNVVNISNKNNIVVKSMQLTDLNGRVIKNINGNETQINISDLNAGVYFLKVSSDQGSGSTKIIKN
ncbi:MAG TPA: choice-of-anchor J domain-containing protein [Flavobacterium sp.]|nr:choice-of-anchor J domain-containing protein [Flavobacterium sp.]